MDQTPGSGRAFFVSIPKCGKNVIHAFFDALGLTRFMIKLDGAVQYTHAKHVEALHRSGAPVPAKSSFEEVVKTLEQLRPEFLQLLKTVRRTPPGTWINQHFAFNAELHSMLREAGVPIVLLCRDPRDCVLSMANFLVNRGEPADWLPKLPQRNVDTALQFFLTGDDERLSFSQIFDSYRGWLQAEGVLVLRFEDIIGPKGGGQTAVQIDRLTALARHIGWEGTAERLITAIFSSFNPAAGTFFKGQIGSWRKGFSPGMLRLFEQVGGGLLTSWGYTRDPTASRSADADAVEDTTTSLLAALRQEYREMVADFERKLQNREKESENRLALMRKHQMTAAEWEAQVEKAQRENAARLELIRKLEGEAAQWKERYELVDAEGKQRLELFRKQEAAAAEWRERYLRAEEESRARLEVARRWEAEAEKWKARCAIAEQESGQPIGGAPERPV